MDFETLERLLGGEAEPGRAAELGDGGGADAMLLHGDDDGGGAAAAFKATTMQQQQRREQELPPAAAPAVAPERATLSLSVDGGRVKVRGSVWGCGVISSSGGARACVRAPSARAPRVLASECCLASSTPKHSLPPTP